MSVRAAAYCVSGVAGGVHTRHWPPRRPGVPLTQRGLRMQRSGSAPLRPRRVERSKSPPAVCLHMWFWVVAGPHAPNTRARNKHRAGTRPMASRGGRTRSHCAAQWWARASACSSA